MLILLGIGRKAGFLRKGILWLLTKQLFASFDPNHVVMSKLIVNI
jgi:hypothetical protein